MLGPFFGMFAIFLLKMAQKWPNTSLLLFPLDHYLFSILSPKSGIFKNCAYIKGIGETEFIADTRSGAIKVKINTQEWICPGIGLVKEERIESTNASAFGTQKYHKELIDYNI